MARIPFLAVFLAACATAATARPQQEQEPIQQVSDKWSWNTNCSPTTVPLHITTIDVSPDPPKPGEDMTVTVEGYTDEPIEDGAYADVTVSVGRIKILHKEFDLCEEARSANASVQCPVSEGTHKVVHTVTLPKEIPPAPFKVHIDAYTVDDEDLLCLDLAIDFRKSRFLSF